MPPTLLTLPRELRDQIYTYILLSPSTLVEPALLRHPPPKTSRNSYSPSHPNEPQPRFLLCTNPLSILPLDPVTSQPVSAHRTHTSLSLLRVCRQIHHETGTIFWDKNTFYFSTFYLSKNTSGILKTLKLMGQIPSRLIQRITIQMSSLNSLYTTFSKCLLSLSSRARHGAFKKLTLVWGQEEWEELVRVNAYGMILGDARFYDDLLDNLGTGGEGCRYERVIEVPGGWDCVSGGYEVRVEEATARALHLAFGGRLFVGGVLAWDGYLRVGGLGKVKKG